MCNIYLQPWKNVQKIKKTHKLQVESIPEILVCMHSEEDWKSPFNFVKLFV